MAAEHLVRAEHTERATLGPLCEGGGPRTHSPEAALTTPPSNGAGVWALLGPQVQCPEAVKVPSRLIPVPTRVLFTHTRAHTCPFSHSGPVWATRINHPPQQTRVSPNDRQLESHLS